MTVDAWLAQFGEPVDADGLAISSADALVKFIERYAGHLAEFIAAYRKDDCELVALNFRTGRPQESFYPIKRIERIGIFFGNSDAMPLVFMLRDEFPDTEHQQLTNEGMPRAICIDDRDWAEARLTWTPAELIQRILSWFSRASRGELHDARQPLDPVLFGSHLSFIVSRAILHDTSHRDLIAVFDQEPHTVLRVVPVDLVNNPSEHAVPICLTTYSIPAERMRRMTYAPNNIGSLADMLSDRGVDLIADIKERFSRWLDEGEAAMWRFNSRFAVIVEMPIIAPGGQQQDGVDVRAFVTDQTVGDIAVALGVALRPGHKDVGSKVGYVKALGEIATNEGAVRSIVAQAAEVHLEFDRTLATQLSGRNIDDERQVVLVGAGAIGSHISDCLSREGRFRWTIIDHDRLLPHNIGRHIGSKEQVSKSKAEIVAHAVNVVIDNPQPIASAITENVTTDGAAREVIDSELERADLVIDGTASILAERFLSDHPSSARRMSVFFNPAGNAGILLAEPKDRAITLRDLEAQYLGQITRNEALAGHLRSPENNFAYTGACRAITNQIPASHITALSGLISDGIGKAADQNDGVIKIWSMSPSGAVDVHEFKPEPVQSFATAGWTVTTDSGLIGRIYAIRDAHLPKETGGVLLGIVDIPKNSIHIVDALPAPPDSTESESGFTRGTHGVQEALDHVLEASRGQVRYIGEWHSHPPRATSMPSPTDLVQIDWLSALFDMDALPALMLIAADDTLNVMLANNQATPIEATEAFALQEAGGQQV